MSAIRLRHIRIVVAICGLSTGVLAARADNTHDYPESGTVIAAMMEHGYVYTIETADKVYQMVCGGGLLLRVSSHPCMSAGRPIAANDILHFRLDGDKAHISNSEGGEEGFIILSTELKILPPIPAPTVAVGECGAVLGAGVEIHGSQTPANPVPVHTAPPPASSAGQTAASSTTAVIPNGPVTAIPVTGGPPVQVNATGPYSGGTITGVTTSGKPVTAVPIGPVTGTPVASTSTPLAPASSGSETAGPGWIHFLRIQTAGKVYDLGCPKSCSLKDRPIQLGDVVVIRIEKNFAYLSWPTPGAENERKFEILDVRGIDEPSPVPPHWVDPHGDGPPLPVKMNRGPEF